MSLWSLILSSGSSAAWPYDSRARVQLSATLKEPFVEGPLLTKEGSGEVLQWRVSNLPLAPSLSKEGVHWPNAPAPRGLGSRWDRTGTIAVAATRLM